MDMKYSIGIDYGSLSGRCVLTRLSDGMIMASAVSVYKHAVMSDRLPSGTKLDQDWALQHPQDYLDVLSETIPAVIREAGTDPEDIVGIGIDFTSCTVLPLGKDGQPLCFAEPDNPHAYVKLWKHHAAQEEADLINSIAEKRGEPFLKRYGGRISSEWLFPKLLQILREDEGTYSRIDCFIEACDWIVYVLSGSLTRNESATGYKAIWSRKDGFPSEDFLAALDERFRYAVRDKMKGRIVPIGTCVGRILPEMADKLGLSRNTAICSGHLDAACSLIGAGIKEPGNMLAVVGTSTCHMIIGRNEHEVPGMCGYVYGGMNPDAYGYEAGQSCVGDHFQWLEENCIPGEYFREASERDISIFQLLAEKAGAKKPGESGLVALDWWNGNRSILVDGQLSGMLLGCTLQTKVEDIYRALVEATAFGTRIIIDTFNANGVPVNAFYCSGGIARKDPFVMQIYADVLGMDVHVVEAKENAALSASILGAVAAGKAGGGYGDVYSAMENMAHRSRGVYAPNDRNHRVYDELYEEYKTLYDYFGRQNHAMRRLKHIAEQNRS